MLGCLKAQCYDFAAMIRTMQFAAALLAALLCLQPALAQEEEGSESELQEQQNNSQLYFRMTEADAESVLSDTENWVEITRVETDSVLEIECVYMEQITYKVMFFNGECFYIEKSALVSSDNVKTTFDRFADKLGPTEEVSESSDKSVIFARWKFDGREVSLSATARGRETYQLIFEEFDPDVRKQAELIQQNELRGGAAG